MPKKKIKKETVIKDYTTPEEVMKLIKDNDDAMQEICNIHKRIDSIVEAIDKSKKVKGL